MKETKQKLTVTTVFLHWLIATGIISLIAIGFYMSNTETFSLYPIHKSIGALLLIPILLRVLWRIRTGWPTPVGQYRQLEHILARTAHWILIIGTLLFPLSGIAMSAAGGYGVSVFGLELVAANFDSVTNKAIPLNAEVANIGHETHEILAILMSITIIVHVMGGLKHHLVDHDGTLRRMLGQKIN